MSSLKRVLSRQAGGRLPSAGTTFTVPDGSSPVAFPIRLLWGHPLQATEFEFHHRLFIIIALFIGGFSCYSLDSVTVAVMFAEWAMGHAVEPSVISGRHVVQAILGFGTGLAILGALVRTWAAAYLRSEVVHDSKIHGDELVADGPYRYVRNPLYLGAVLFAVGFSMAASRLGFVVIVGGLIVFYSRLIAREESLLRGTQGESYREFLAMVPKLMPSLSPRAAARGLAPQWGQAVVGEASMWIFVIVLTCFAVTLDQRLFLAMAASGAAASLAWSAVLRRMGHCDIRQEDDKARFADPPR